MWTIEELVERVGRALAGQYPGAPNGRVRDLPDRRAVRWYATTGLIDRPAAMRGRTALYGPRHLLQLVAVKRRQAAGRTLAEIQAELAGASDTALAAIALVPDDLLAADEDAATATPARPRFWAAAPMARAKLDGTDEALRNGAAGPAPLTGITLGGGVLLLVPGRPAGDDYAAIAAAARPLLDLLATQGLTDAPHHDGSSR